VPGIFLDTGYMEVAKVSAIEIEARLLKESDGFAGLKVILDEERAAFHKAKPRRVWYLLAFSAAGFGVVFSLGVGVFYLVALLAGLADDATLNSIGLFGFVMYFLSLLVTGAMISNMKHEALEPAVVKRIFALNFPGRDELLETYVRSNKLSLFDLDAFVSDADRKIEEAERREALLAEINLQPK
jgi:hypothetical protein